MKSEAVARLLDARAQQILAFSSGRQVGLAEVAEQLMSLKGRSLFRVEHLGVRSFEDGHPDWLVLFGQGPQAGIR